jgi:hypothetical protein
MIITWASPSLCPLDALGSRVAWGSVSPKCRDSHRIEDAPRPLHPLTRWGKSQHPWALVNKKYFFTHLDGFLMQMARVRLKAGLT